MYYYRDNNKVETYKYIKAIVVSGEILVVRHVVAGIELDPDTRPHRSRTSRSRESLASTSSSAGYYRITTTQPPVSISVARMGVFSKVALMKFKYLHDGRVAVY